MLRKSALFFLCITLLHQAFGQQKAYQKNIVNSKDSSLFISFIKLFKGAPNPLIDSTSINIEKSIKGIENQEGKRINHIYFEHRRFSSLGFSDSASRYTILTNFVNQFHSHTKEEAIRKNLFFHEDEYLNPLVIAYNEKWLRELSYIQDARIIAFPLKNDSNSVDLYVVTKDVFPFGATLQLNKANAYNASATIENIKNLGNSFTLYQNFDLDRNHKTGWGFNYSQRNIKGSFIDVNVGAHSLENNYANAASSANSIYINGSRPLLNPLSKWTGGFEWSYSKNNNEFPQSWSDSLYNANLKYKLAHWDSWLGYQLFNTSWKVNNEAYRHFVQVRYLDNNFNSRPDNYNLLYDRNYLNIAAYLSSYTLFKQKIIRTQYLYGFGRNEDLPSGTSYTLTMGKYRKEQMNLPYLGATYESFTLQKNERFRHLMASAGTSYHQGQIIDFKFIANWEQINPLHYLESGYKYRSILNLSFAQTLKNKFNDALLINSIYGIPQLSGERINGGTRISANWESIWYNARSFYGFKQSPFAFANITYIRTVGTPISSGDFYTALGGGSRIRNESLIFGTVELKAFYFPRTHLQMSPWNFSITTNLKFKYNSSLLSKPDFVQIN
ncbi:MAG: hypothetical protein RLZ56_1432 [Bacteroidota bacterium]|jgi:hypothetical protein